jgi:hypothetical protein
MKTETIQIIDYGRGPQLSTSRITVLDLIPYFQRSCSFEEIIRWIPSLSQGEIAVVERYYLEHKAECDENDRRASAYREEQIRLQRQRFPEFKGSEADHTFRLKQLLERRRQQKNGAGHSG